MGEEIPSDIGPYQVLKLLGRGGMGEVFLVHDPICQRQIALKRIVPEKIEKMNYLGQFLNEAKLTAQLTHPSIIPIYSIVSDGPLIYYTMPYIEGMSLKNLIIQARDAEETHSPVLPNTSVMSFAYMFLQICRAIAYAYSKGVIHRDLKPSNILIDQQGTSYILDWGLIQPLDIIKNQVEADGKIAGTLLYIAPEVMLGGPPNMQSEIYSLGLIFYEMLTLRYPFHRSNANEYNEYLNKDVLANPSDVATTRDIPPLFSQIVLRCLETALDKRYQTFEALIQDLTSYLELRSNWVKMAELDPHSQKQWDSCKTYKMGKKNLRYLLSKQPFTKNLRLEIDVLPHSQCKGIAFFLNAPNGDCIWFTADFNSSSAFFREEKKQFEIVDLLLKKDEWNHIRIDQINHHIYIYLNHTLQFSFANLIPQKQSQIGVIKPNVDCELQAISVFVDSKTLYGNHLTVADLLFSSQDYVQAIKEYHKISELFPKTIEGALACFYEGMVYLEQAKKTKNSLKKAGLVRAAKSQLKKLHGTVGEPLEYLGYIHIHQLKKELNKQIQTFEIAFEKFPFHPLIYLLNDQLMYCLFVAKSDGKLDFLKLSLLAIRYLHPSLITFLLPPLNENFNIPEDLQISNLTGWEKQFELYLKGIQLAFFFKNPEVIVELMQKSLKIVPTPLDLLKCAFFALLKLNEYRLIENELNHLYQTLLDVQAVVFLDWIKLIIKANQGDFSGIDFLTKMPINIDKDCLTIIKFLIQAAKKKKNSLALNEIKNIILSLKIK